MCVNIVWKERTERREVRVARPTLETVADFYTTRQVAKILEISRAQLIRRLRRGVLPKPTSVDENGTRLFDQEWVDEAKVLLRRARF